MTKFRVWYYVGDGEPSAILLIGRGNVRSDPTQRTRKRTNIEEPTKHKNEEEARQSAKGTLSLPMPEEFRRWENLKVLHLAYHNRVRKDRHRRTVHQNAQGTPSRKECHGADDADKDCA